MVNVGYTSILIAELWGLREGLRLCQFLGLSRVIAEMDAFISVCLVNENREPDNLFLAILLEIKNLMQGIDVCILQHTLREDNAAADYLASLGHSTAPGLHIWDSPPSELWNILEGDQMGVIEDGSASQLPHANE
ncbi:hypothetical protein SLEP1_g55908 [Rubroshorea leprosula]|uniref:RNase H type-1 domain-containing protein n=1 Tax=Rubroshorea leprosula TaxID=152421 RepID=A0AAV5MI05_9ROSI|nr:hypothetical protein SLEP1_g55908 [Rubroshorea leprosula]